MTVAELHHTLKTRFNKLSNNHRRYLTDVEVDEALNEGVRLYVDKYTHGLTDQRDGQEKHQKAIDMLRTLTVRVLEPLASSTYSLPADYRHYISSRVHHPTNCPGKWFLVRIEQHGDLGRVRKGYHRRANDRFREIPAAIRGDSLELEQGSLSLVGFEIELTYVRKPAVIRLGTYPPVDDQGGPDLPLQDCDLPPDYHPQVVDLAVQYLATVYNMGSLLQVTKDKIATAS